jgi:undecaprenyl-diphosphatase
VPHLTLLAAHAELSYFQAIVMGLLQGITELFPVSSLGHSVLIPALLGWDNLTRGQDSGESFFLAFVVGLHVGTAVALIAYYWRTWLGLTGGLFTSVRDRSLAKPNERLIWLIILATIPVGIVGLAFEHKLRTQFAKPLSAAIFLTINGVLLLGAEVLRRRTLARGGRIRAPKGRHAAGLATPDDEATSFRRLDSLPLLRGVAIGCSQILALFAGISRSGVTMGSGIATGLDHEDSAKFSFLLATPVILAAGLLKLPDLFGPLGAGIRGQCIAGAIAAGVAAFGAVAFLVRWFETRTLWPFGVYCLVVGGLCIIRFA